jgi:hypothetical protein
MGNHGEPMKQSEADPFGGPGMPRSIEVGLPNLSFSVRGRSQATIASNRLEAVLDEAYKNAPRHGPKDVTPILPAERECSFGRLFTLVHRFADRNRAGPISADDQALEAGILSIRCGLNPPAYPPLVRKSHCCAIGCRSGSWDRRRSLRSPGGYVQLTQPSGQRSDQSTSGGRRRRMPCRDCARVGFTRKFADHKYAVQGPLRHAALLLSRTSHDCGYHPDSLLSITSLRLPPVKPMHRARHTVCAHRRNALRCQLPQGTNQSPSASSCPPGTAGKRTTYPPLEAKRCPGARPNLG